MTEGPVPRLSGALAQSRVPLPGTTNVRDLAGYPGCPGWMIGPHRLFRGEVLADADASEFQGLWDEQHRREFQGLGLRTVIDLRAEHEARRTPSVWRRATGADVVALPIAEGGEGTDTNYIRKLLSGEMPRFDEDHMTQFYCDTLDRRASTFASAIAVLADPQRLPALAHCSAGKDRTGLLVALVLELVGTPRALVVEDYTLTGVLRPNRIAAYTVLFTDAGVDPDAARVLFETPAASMVGALAHLDDTYGGVADYLVSAGSLPTQTVDALRNALLIPSDLK
ncbi:tyrosine-protein phosphatase [Rhodococcus opacus]|uniref:tyrosine-protein phosphatase n=1 Tax=Rhodococcus opacus TaxID=37919 RepID=UPI001C48F6E0|nr:tyrosine-protein phosphatase [Rhodococcus opacus]MBV6755105.1 tyrosine-protein phosphatase [Rhodococcus opacus]